MQKKLAHMGTKGALSARNINIAIYKTNMEASVGHCQAGTLQNRIMETQSQTDDLTSGPSLF